MIFRSAYLSRSYSFLSRGAKMHSEKPSLQKSFSTKAFVGTFILAAFMVFAATPTLFKVQVAHAQNLRGDLVIFLAVSNPAPRRAMETLVDRFQKLNPDLNIETTIIDREAYKTQIRNFLTANPPDIAEWYAGNRMLPYVNAGLFEDVSDLWNGSLSRDLASTKKAMTIDGKQWGVPYTYYNWGVYYRKDIYERYGLTEPKTWDQFKLNCQTLLQNNIKCFSIGTKFLWTAAGWFDYINLRTNGYEFHMDLTAGKIPWTDARVRKTFEHWRELIEMGGYIDNHTSYSWQEALPFMVKGQAASYLIGNFAVDPLRTAGLDDSKLDFHPFPAITPGLPQAEEAPSDTLHIPSGAKNKENARAFLRFMASAEMQTMINDILQQLPVNSKSEVSNDKFLREGFDLLSNAYALSQFFDRDAPAEMAKVAMEGFQEFMVKPNATDRILKRLESSRKRIYR